MPVGYGIKKLQISCVVEDDKVGTDLLEEEITKFDDQVYYHRHNSLVFIAAPGIGGLEKHLRY